MVCGRRPAICGDKVIKNSSTTPAARNAPNRVGPPSCSSLRIPNCELSNWRMAAGPMMPTSVSTGLYNWRPHREWRQNSRGRRGAPRDRRENAGLRRTARATPAAEPARRGPGRGQAEFVRGAFDVFAGRKSGKSMYRETTRCSSRTPGWNRQRGVGGKLMTCIQNKNWTGALQRLTLYGAGSGPERIRENVLE